MKRFFNSLLYSAAALGACAQLGCGRPETDSAQPASGQAALTSLPTLNTFIANSLEIDQLGTGLSPADANLFLGADPADGTASAQKPTGGPATFIDWNDLSGNVANHRLQDLSLPSGKDPSSFPHSNECVGTSNVLSKMDLTYVAAANNNKYAYFAVQRSNNNGDAGYYWLFTKLPPQMISGQSPCGTGESRLLYDISVGDVLLGGHFKPNGTPLLRVFKATQNSSGVTAVSAINFQSALWLEDPNGVAAAAVNTTITSPDSLGTDGVLALSGGNLGPEIFAEAAVPVSIFTGGNNCGAVFFGSVITRSSGSGGTSPDLKDLAGPAIFNFGDISATAEIRPTCTLDVEFEVTGATGSDGTPIVNPTCEWTFDDGTTATGCSGITALTAGSRTGTVKVTDSANGCTDTVTTAPITVCSPLSLEADLVGTCEGTFTFSAVPAGGCGGVTYSWLFPGGGIVTPSSSTDASGTATVDTGGATYSGTVTATDTRTDGLICTAAASDDTVVYMPIQVSLALAAAAQVCPAMTDDSAQYQAVVTGGTGNYTLGWNGASCSGFACVINPADNAFCYSQSLSVTASDDSGLCPAATSETESYSKLTVVNVSDN
jgi:hypothetical protein